MMNEILETLTFLKILSVSIWQTYIYSWQWSINWNKDYHVPVAHYQCCKVVLWAWNTASYAWLFKYFVNIVKSHTQQATVPFQGFGVFHLKIIPYFISLNTCQMWRSVPASLNYLCINADMVFIQDTWK